MKIPMITVVQFLEIRYSLVLDKLVMFNLN